MTKTNVIITSCAVTAEEKNAKKFVFTITYPLNSCF